VPPRDAADRRRTLPRGGHGQRQRGGGVHVCYARARCARAVPRRRVCARVGAYRGRLGGGAAAGDRPADRCCGSRRRPRAPDRAEPPPRARARFPARRDRDHGRRTRGRGPAARLRAVLVAARIGRAQRHRSCNDDTPRCRPERGRWLAGAQAHFPARTAVRNTAVAGRLSEPVRSTRAAMLLRSFSVQATWNYRTLLGAGFAFVMLPVLRELYGRDRERLREAVARHSAVFNCHPYLVGVAAGAVARLEAEGADPRLIDRFKAAVRGSLGSLGDQLIWAGWRPVCALLALLLLLVGMPWWVVCGAFLIAYNAGHLAARIYAFRLGWEHGTGVAEKLRQPWVAEVQRRIATTGAFLLGVLLPLVAGGRTLALPHPVIAAAAAGLGLLVGLRFGNAVRTPVVLVLVAF